MGGNRVLREAGFIINLKKSALIPSQRFQYLGLIWDTIQAQISLPPQRFQDFSSMVSQLLLSKQPHCNYLMRLLGFMSAAIPAIPLIRLKSRHLQRSLIQV